MTDFATKAREIAQAKSWNDGVLPIELSFLADLITAALEEAVVAEREACAKHAELFTSLVASPTDAGEIAQKTGEAIAAAIRNRKET
jgi:hypothetical protein